MNRYEETVRMWQSYAIKNASDLDRYLENFEIIFAYHSGKIENQDITYYDTREIFQNGRVTGYTGDPRVLFEQQNQKICAEFIKQKFTVKEQLSIDFIKEVHSTLTSGTYDIKRYIDNGERPGQFKRHDYVTGIHEIGAGADEVEPMLRDLLDEINGNDIGQTLRVGAYFHVRFEYIHPFADGNGRTGRTLLNYFLITRNHPPLIIHEEDKHEYYAALEAYDTDEVIDPLYDFLVNQTIKTWDKTFSRVKT